MSRKQRSRYVMWTEAKTPVVEPTVYGLLSPLVQHLALIEDVTGPPCAEVARDIYVAHLAAQLHEPVARVLREASVAVAAEKLAEICHMAASETFVIRALNEARLGGEITLEDFRHLPFYGTYQDYFEQRPGIATPPGDPRESGELGDL